MQRHALLIVMAMLCSHARAAEEAEEFFDSLFGAKMKQVRSTVDRSDDLVLAREILAAAQTVDRPDLLPLMCENVIDLSQRQPDGLSIAVEAARLRVAKVEAGRDTARSKLVELLTRQSSSSDAKLKQDASDELLDVLMVHGDELLSAGKYDDALRVQRQALAAAHRYKSPLAALIRENLEAAGNRSRVETLIARLREKLLADAADTASANEIVRMYVFELDAPAQALKMLDRADDAKLVQLVPLATKPADSLTPADCAALGEWYLEASATASKSSKEMLWRRVSIYLERVIDSDADQLTKVKAQLQLKPVTISLATAEAERSKILLKRTTPETWISSDATYKVSSGNGFHPPRPDLLTGGKNLHDGHFAFHTAENTTGQFITIDLGSPKVISKIWIENRRSDNGTRAKGMTLSLSMTEDDPGKIIWTAEKVSKDWTIQFPDNVKARYLTIKQEEGKREPLHLAQVKVFGWEK